MIISSTQGSRWTRAAVALLLSARVAASQAAGPIGDARPITLDEAVRLAQASQPATVQARNALRTGDASIRQTLLGYLPSLTLSQSANQRGGTTIVQGVPLPLTGNPWSYSQSLSFGQVVVFDGFQRWNNYRTNQANQDANVANITTQQYSVSLNVKTAYFGVLTAREQAAAAQRQLEQAQQQLVVSVAKMNAGSATRSDSLSGAIAVGNARQAVLNAQNALLNANAQLTRYVATPFTVTATPGDTADVADITLSDTQLAEMAGRGPAVAQAQALLTAADAAQRAAKAPYLPQITVGGSYGRTPPTSKTYNFNGGDGPTTTSTALNFGINWTLFNNYTREANIVTTRVNYENATANLRDARFFAEQNLVTFINNFRTAILSIELNKLQIVAAEENLRVTQQQYNLGTKQLLDLLTAQTQLDNSRAALIQARLTARLAKANIETIIGRDLK